MIQDALIKADLPEDAGSGQDKALAFRLAQDQASEALEEINNGINTIGLTALKYHGSTLAPGEMATIFEGEKGEVFDESVFQMKPGDLCAEPILVNQGYMIVRVVEFLPEIQKSLEEVKPELELWIRKKKMEEARFNLEDLYFNKHQVSILEDRFLAKGFPRKVDSFTNSQRENSETISTNFSSSSVQEFSNSREEPKETKKSETEQGNSLEIQNKVKPNENLNPERERRDDPLKVLQMLKNMLDQNLITQEEFDIKKKEILSRI